MTQVPCPPSADAAAPVPVKGSQVQMSVDTNELYC